MSARDKKRRRNQRARVFAEQRGCCYLCELPMLLGPGKNDPLFATWDHIVPTCAGGGNALANRQLAHQICNVAKADKQLRFAITAARVKKAKADVERLLAEREALAVAPSYVEVTSPRVPAAPRHGLPIAFNEWSTDTGVSR